MLVQEFGDPNKFQKLANHFLLNLCTIGIEYLPVAAGSPGPFDKNIPCGFSLNKFSTLFYRIQL